MIAVYLCYEFDDGFYLREQLSLWCDSSDHNWMKIFSGVALIGYPVGAPLVLYAVIYYHRDAIRKLGNELHHQQQRTGRGLDISKLSTSRYFLRSPLICVFDRT